MNKTKLEKAKKIIKKLSEKYDGFINVGFDNWRGFRFIFDTKDVRECNNNCKKCPLYKLLKKEKISKDLFGLYCATKEDKKLFGPQNYLNCKTIKQYENCFVNFIAKKCKTDKEIKAELKLIKNFKIIYSTEGNAKNIEREFKRLVLKRINNHLKIEGD